MDDYINKNREEIKSMPRQKYSSSFKVRTVLEGLKSPDGISSYCRRQGISEVQFYQWQKQMLTNADALFTKLPKSTERKIANLEEEVKRKDHIIAVVTEEALELKKKLIN
jgi:transposase-like protein